MIPPNKALVRLLTPFIGAEDCPENREKMKILIARHLDLEDEIADQAVDGILSLEKH